MPPVRDWGAHDHQSRIDDALVLARELGNRHSPVPALPRARELFVLLAGQWERYPWRYFQLDHSQLARGLYVHGHRDQPSRKQVANNGGFSVVAASASMSHSTSGPSAQLTFTCSGLSGQTCSGGFAVTAAMRRSGAARWWVSRPVSTSTTRSARRSCWSTSGAGPTASPPAARRTSPSC